MESYNNQYLNQYNIGNIYHPYDDNGKYNTIYLDAKQITKKKNINIDGKVAIKSK
jgi:hypothetical protein